MPRIIDFKHFSVNVAGACKQLHKWSNLPIKRKRRFRGEDENGNEHFDNYEFALIDRSAPKLLDASFQVLLEASGKNDRPKTKQEAAKAMAEEMQALAEKLAALS